jgi:hypothetical protein
MKTRLSLTCITGNCEQDINRFLDAFQPLVDEVVIVRAIGSQTPDRTLDIARDRGCVTGEYENALTAQDWPHVDNFADARNKALALATGDWCMWADMDDDIIDGHQIRALIDAAPPDQWMISCPYVVSEQGVIANYRERLWRNNVGCRWLNAIHENLLPPVEMPRPCVGTDAFHIRHIPRADKGCTQDRNLRILESIPEDERTVGHRFYHAQELIRRDDPQAVAAAKAFLADPDSNTPERFEMHMALAGKADDYGVKAGIYLQAFAEDPSRAEALYELAALSLACDQPQRAVHFAELMMACRWPEDPCWNHRRMFYGFWREDLYWQCLRAAGDPRGDILRANAATASRLPIISLIHATRGRAFQASKTRQKWIRAADHPERIEHIFGLDFADHDSHVLRRFPSRYQPQDKPGCVAAWNTAAEASTGNVIVQLSDDWEPTAGWDTAILQAIGDLDKPAVLAISDGHRQDDLLCMAIMTRARYKQQNHMFHPEFFSMFSDNWFSHCAFRDGVVIDARENIRFEHLHPAFGKAEMDETYARSNAAYHYQTGQGIMQRLLERDGGFNAGFKLSSEIEGWFDFRDVYDRVAIGMPDGGAFVEVGSWKGKSICYLRDRLDDIGNRKASILAVDTFEGDADAGFENTFREFANNVQTRSIAIYRGTSIDAAADHKDVSLDGVFIDAAHDYESVKADIAAWLPKVKSAGFFGGHDIDAPGVLRAVDESGIPFDVIGGCWIRKQPKP